MAKRSTRKPIPKQKTKPETKTKATKTEAKPKAATTTKTNTSKAAKASKAKPSKAKPSAKPSAKTSKAKASATTSKAKASKATPATTMVARRDDYGAPIDGYFDKQPEALRPILLKLRELVEAAAPEAVSSLKWGMPHYALNGQMLCALAAHKAHVNLVLPGTTDTYDDPDELLEGESKLGKHLKVRSLEELPVEAVEGWLRTAVARVSE